jgi:hypothetical protein
MGITIFAGGCRYIGDDGQIQVRNCDDCIQQKFCDREPRARELAAKIAGQWIKTSDRLPLDREPILYLEYPSSVPTGTVHYGYYDGKRKSYTEWGSGHTLTKQRIIAWIQAAPVPEHVYETRDPSLEDI